LTTDLSRTNHNSSRLLPRMFLLRTALVDLFHLRMNYL
jgi:hypothetical protein